MTGDLFVIVAVVVVVAMMQKMVKEETERAQASDVGASGFCRFFRRGGEIFVERYTTTQPKLKRPGIRFNNATG
jgi:hypothetical protein